MKRHILTPLTDTEKKFAEENHNLIYSFIHRYRYSIEEHYNILVFGYLKAVQIYLNRKDLQEKYDFPFVCWMYLRREIGNYFTTESSKKRKSLEKVFSLDADYAEMENQYNTVSKETLDNRIIEAESMEKLLQGLSSTQRKIIRMKVDGYSNKEIYLILEIKQSTYYKEMQRIKKTLEKARSGRIN